jgi:hypothetical protein
MGQLRSAPDYRVEEDPGSGPGVLADWLIQKGSVCRQVSSQGKKSCANERPDDMATKKKAQRDAQNLASRECSTSETLQSAIQTTGKRHTDSGTWWPVRERRNRTGKRPIEKRRYDCSDRRSTYQTLPRSLPFHSRLRSRSIREITGPEHRCIKTLPRQPVLLGTGGIFMGIRCREEIHGQTDYSS